MTNYYNLINTTRFRSCNEYCPIAM